MSLSSVHVVDCALKGNAISGTYGRNITSNNDPFYFEIFSFYILVVAKYD